MLDHTLKAALSEARALLRSPPRVREPIWPTLAAAAFFAVSALTFAFASLLAPPVVSHTPPAQSSALRGIN